MSIIVSLIALFVSLSLLGRVKHLERIIAAGSVPSAVKTPSPTPSSAPVAAPATPVRPEPTLPAAPAPLAAAPAQPSFVSAAIDWMAKDWLMKLGAVLLFLGIGWIVTVFFWDAIGAVGHVLFGFFIGVVFLVFGNSRIRRYHNQGGVFVVLGAGVIYLTTYAASPAYYDLILPEVAIGFMFLTSVFVTYLAVATRIFSIALFGLLLGLMAPLLSGAPHSTFSGLFSYLFVLAISTLWTSSVTRWRSLTLVSVIAYGMYSIPYFGNHTALVGDVVVALLVILFGALYFLVGLRSIVTDREVVPADLWVTGLNSLLILNWIHVLIPSTGGRVYFCVLVAVVASIGAFVTYLYTRLQEPVTVHSLLAAAFIVAATAYALDGPMFRLAIMAEATGALLLWRMIFGVEKARKAAWVSVVPMMLGLISLLEYAHYSTVAAYRTLSVVDDNFAVVTVAVALILLYGYLFRIPRQLDDKRMALSQLFFVVGSVMLLIFFWFFAQRLLPGDAGTMLSLFVYTFIGLMMYVPAKMGIREAWKIPGATLLAFVVGHLLLVDIGGMDTIGRIITFTLVGLLLISTSFIHKKESINSHV